MGLRPKFRSEWNFSRMSSNSFDCWTSASCSASSSMEIECRLELMIPINTSCLELIWLVFAMNWSNSKSWMTDRRSTRHEQVSYAIVARPSRIKRWRIKLGQTKGSSGSTRSSRADRLPSVLNAIDHLCIEKRRLLSSQSLLYGGKIHWRATLLHFHALLHGSGRFWMWHELCDAPLD